MNLKILCIAMLLATAVACTQNPSQTQVRTADFIEAVDPMIGSGGHGHVFVGADVPHGMVQLGPHQPNRGWDWCSGYHWSDTLVLGFSHSRLSGTGIGELGDVLIMPYDANNIKREENGHLYARLDHSKEVAGPGYYRLYMPDSGVYAEFTATERVGYHRYVFTGTLGSLLVDLKTGTGWDSMIKSDIHLIDNTHIAGYRRSTGWAKDQIYYFCAEFSRPISGYSSKGASMNLSFVLEEDSVLEVKVALSPVSEENARESISREIPGWDFQKTLAQARDKWNEELGRIEIEPMDATQERIFYTSLYHTMLAPYIFSDVDGSYRGADRQIHTSARPVYTIFSIWDTYRAAMPLTTLIDPELATDIAATFLDIYREQGKLPVWHLCGNETDCMVGNPGVITIGDFFIKGLIPKELQEETLEAMKTSSMRDERGMKFLKEYGYIPFDKSEEVETVSKGLEFAIADAAVAKVAEALGDTGAQEYFGRRSKSYQYYFDPETRFMRGRASDGSYREPFDPFKAIHMKSDFTEGNAWQYTWLVPHDVAGLVALLGGEEAFIEKLEELFVAEGDLGPDANDVTGLIGQYAHGNEPSHHVAYMFNSVGRQWRCAELVRYIMDNLYADDPDGICGNEDVGQMSAWYVLSALGLYQADPVSPVFQIGSPAVKSAVMHVGNGKKFSIIAHDNSPENIYVQSARLNGKPLDTPYITYNDITTGGTLELQMGGSPSDFGASCHVK